MKQAGLRRRTILKAIAGGILLPSLAQAFGPSSRVDICELDLGPGSLSRPGAWKRLLYDLEGTTSVEIEPRPVRLRPDAPELFEHPFSVVMGKDAFGIPDEASLQQLARYIAYGGFILFDDVSGLESSGFYTSVRRLLRILFPTRSLTPLPASHSVFRSFFLLRDPVGRVSRHPFLEGVTVGNLSPVMVCRNDLSGALDRGRDGRHTWPCVPGGERQRREAVKLGINLMMYSLTANYKSDQVHVRELILKGRWSE